MVNEVQIKDTVSEIMYMFSHNYLSALEATFDKNEVYGNNYSIGKISDDAICLVNDGNSWEVLYSERGHEEILSSHDNILDACKYMIEEMSENDVMVQKMTSDFHSILSTSENMDTSSTSKLKSLISQFASSVAMI